MPRLPFRLTLATLSLMLFTVAAQAAVTRVEIKSRTVVADGKWFGAAGPYEKVIGTVYFEIDPTEPHNAAITDIALAPRNARGRVEFSSDFYILAPQDAARASGSVLFEVSNRGGKGLLGTFNRARPSADPMAAEDFGDGLLMHRGFTLVWVGWEFDVAGLHVTPPIAKKNGEAIVETIAAQFVVDARATEVSLGDVPMYPPFDPNDETATLTVRDKIWDRPAPLPRRGWQFVPPPAAGGGGRCSGDVKCPRVSMAAGFEPGRIYEVRYRASNPPISGVGLAAIRDVASAIKYGTQMPVRGRFLHIYGASQSGRFLRTYLYDGFNADESGRKVFDGMMPHIAGAARADFNTRFSQAVGLDQFGALKFPFTDASQRDDKTGRTDALLGKYTPEQQPKIMYTNSSVEYWGTGRVAALVHASIDGAADLTLPANVRAYLVAGSQHGPAAFPPRAQLGDGPNARGVGSQLPNPTPHTIALRAFVLALDRWVRDGVEPPASKYPRLADGTLAPIAKLAWPALPGVTSPSIIPEPHRARVDSPEGTWPFLVPQVDEDGNERGGIRLPDVAVPLGTSTGWNFRTPSSGNPTNIVPLLGSFIPFARTAADRAAVKDPRKSVAERYASKQDYLGRVTEVTIDLTKQGYLLKEDATFLLERAAATWDWLAQRSTATAAQR